MSPVPAFRIINNGGSRQTLSATHVIVGGVARPINSLTRVGNTPSPDPGPPPPPPPPPPVVRELGIYNGDYTENPDDGCLTSFGSYPALAVTYHQPNQQATSISQHTARLNKGINLLNALTTKGTQKLVGIAGNSDAATNAADRAWLDEFLDANQALSLVDPRRKVRICLEQEMEVKVVQGVLTGAAAGFVNFGQALNWFFARAKVRCPNVEIGWWMGGASEQRTNIATVWANITETHDWYAHDPYSQSGSSPALTWKGRNDDVRTGVYSTHWIRLGRPDVCIAETGTNKASQTDAEMAAWLKNIPAAMVSEDVPWAVYFNRDSGPRGDWCLTAGTFMPRPMSVAAFGEALRTVNNPTAPPPSAVQISGISSTLTTIGDPDSSGALIEVSGLVVSAQSTATGRVLWAVNDQGIPANVYAIGDVSGGTLLHTATISGQANAAQFEEISKCELPSGGPGLMVGRIGNGFSSFHRIPEPVVTPGQVSATSTVAADTFTFTAVVTDHEAFFVDPITGDLFLLAKQQSTLRPATARVWRIPAAQLKAGGGVVTLTLVGEITVSVESTNNGAPTAADITDDGRHILVGNYQEIFIWPRNVAGAQSVSEVFTSTPTAPVRSYYPSGLGTESLAFDRGSEPARIYSMAEGVLSSLKYADLTYAVTP